MDGRFRLSRTGAPGPNRKLAMLDSAQQSGRSEFGVGADHVRHLVPIMSVGALAMVRPLA